MTVDEIMNMILIANTVWVIIMMWVIFKIGEDVQEIKRKLKDKE